MRSTPVETTWSETSQWHESEGSRGAIAGELGAESRDKGMPTGASYQEEARFVHIPSTFHTFHTCPPKSAASV